MMPWMSGECAILIFMKNCILRFQKSRLRWLNVPHVPISGQVNLLLITKGNQPLGIEHHHVW